MRAYFHAPPRFRSPSEKLETENTWRAGCLRNGNVRWGPIPCDPGGTSPVPPPTVDTAERRPRRCPSSNPCPAGTPVDAGERKTSRCSAAVATGPRDRETLRECAAEYRARLVRKDRARPPIPRSSVQAQVSLVASLQYFGAGRYGGWIARPLSPS